MKKKKNPPEISSLDELALCLKDDKTTLLMVSSDMQGHCVKQVRKDKKGKPKTFIAPDKDLKAIQRTIKKEILELVPTPDNMFGSKKGGSIKKNAQLHVGQPVVGTLDIQNFFPSIKYPRVLALYHKLGYKGVVAKTLAGLSTHKGVVPRGFPTSSLVAGIVLSNMCQRLKNLCKTHGVVFSIWVDDVFFSGSKRVNKLRNLFCKIIESEGFTVHPDKIDFNDRTVAQTVTGLVVNSGVVNVRRKYRRNLRELLSRCVKYGPSSQAEVEMSKFKASLRGKISYIASISPGKEQAFLRYFNIIDWSK